MNARDFRYSARPGENQFSFEKNQFMFLPELFFSFSSFLFTLSKSAPISVDTRSVKLPSKNRKKGARSHKRRVRAQAQIKLMRGVRRSQSHFFFEGRACSRRKDIQNKVLC